MNYANKIFKIMILEDDGFYNNMFMKYLSNYTDEIALDYKIEIEISSFTNYEDFLRNLKPDVDISFVDFYLGHGKTGLDIIKEIKKISANCKIVIISQSMGVSASLLTLNEGATDFIHKDKDAFTKSCHLVEAVINDKLEKSTDLN
jgi:DNA-binding NtrC family response regulator